MRIYPEMLWECVKKSMYTLIIVHTAFKKMCQICKQNPWGINPLDAVCACYADTDQH